MDAAFLPQARCWFLQVKQLFSLVERSTARSESVVGRSLPAHEEEWMRPGMYGYLRLTASSADDENRTLQHDLATHAEREGFTLERTFVERLRANEPAFDCLTEALKASGVRNVIVPSLWHFARLPGLQTAMHEHIEYELGARVWIVQGVQR